MQASQPAPLAVVTGAAGFIGSQVSRALSALGYVVRGAGRGTDVELLTNESLVLIGERTELIVHCAGGSSVGQSVQAPLADFEKSVPPFASVLERARTHAPQAKLVLLSSAAVYGDAERFPTDETVPLRPISPYGYHKRMCEELCISYGRNFGVSSAVVRLFSVYGAGLRKQLLWDACQKATAGERQFQGTGRELRDWLHVDDAVALVLAAARAASPEVPIVNGGSGVGTPVVKIVGDVFLALQAGVPEFVGGGRPGDPARYVADIARARALGWQPTIDLERGLAAYVQWFKAQV
jgi:UDP-glucose 4-epimerase